MNDRVDELRHKAVQLREQARLLEEEAYAIELAIKRGKGAHVIAPKAGVISLKDE